VLVGTKPRPRVSPSGLMVNSCRVATTPDRARGLTAWARCVVFAVTTWALVPPGSVQLGASRLSEVRPTLDAQPEPRAQGPRRLYPMPI
jgi:hypothetical protein